MKKAPNRIVKLLYGNGCRLHDNCFDCPMLPDCQCSTRDIEGKKAKYVNVGLIFAEGGMLGENTKL